jgi:multidrug efflux pump subunit AcrB
VHAIIEFFIHRPRLNYMLFVSLFLAGVYSYMVMPKEIFPPLNLDKIVITGAYAGASPAMLNQLAVTPIEDEVSTISHLRSVQSTVSSGAFSIILELERTADKIDTLQKAKDAVALVKPDLPTDMVEPSVRFFEFSIPLILVNIASDSVDSDKIISIAKEFKTRLTQIPNLIDIRIYGEGDQQIRIKLDSKKLEAYNLSLESVSTAISSISSIFPIGKVEDPDGHVFVSTLNGAKNTQDLLDTIININGKQLYLRDIATAHKGYAQDQTRSSYEGKRSVSINIAKSEEGNSMELASKVKSLVAEFSHEHPELSMGTFSDTSVYIENRLNTVVSNILFGLILVGLVMHLLVNARISLVVIIGVPTSFIVALLFMDIAGYSINMMTLLGALIAIGVIVDDAIIVAENIQRHIENGDSPKDAAIKGTKEVIAPVMAASLTTIFAFLPMLIISGEMGEFIKLIPIAITVLIAASIIESFIFLPIHANHLLKPKSKEVDWSKASKIYLKIIETLIKYRKTTLFTFWIVVPLLIVGGVVSNQFKIFPAFDGDQMNISAKLPANTTLEESFEIAQDLEQKLLSLREKYAIASVTTIAGFRMNAKGEGENGDNLFHIFVDLERIKPDNFVSKYVTPILLMDFKSWDYNRTQKSYDIEPKMRAELEEFMSKYETQTFEVKGPNAGVMSMPIELYVYGNDNTQTEAAIKKIKEALGKIEGTNTIGDDANKGTKEVKLKINPYGQKLGITEGMLTQRLASYFLENTRAKGFDNQGLVEIILQDARKDSYERLRTFPLLLDSGQKVALGDVVDFIEEHNYEKLYKKEGQKRWMVFSNVEPKIAPSTVLKKLEPTLESVQKEFNVEVGFGGEKEQNDQLLREMTIASVVAMFLIFVTLLVMFDSFKLSLMVLSVVPFSFFGVVLGHTVMGMDFSMPSAIGALGLAGVVINDGIIMLDFIRKANNIETLLAQAKLRLRPIILTSITTLVGLSTLIFFPSGQAVILQPLAVSLGFGLLWGTFLNLVYLPTLYAFIVGTKNKNSALHVKS